jgi:acetyl esterase/lipase
VPIGGLILGFCVLVAVAPIRRPRSLALMSWIASAAPNEVPYLFMYIVVASNLPNLATVTALQPQDWSALGVAALTIVGLAIVACRAWPASRVLDDALTDELGPRWQSDIEPRLAGRLPRRRPWLRILVVPWPFRPLSVERVADIRYGDRSEQVLDVYRHRSHPSRSPTLIYFHGGGFTRGRKNFEARPLVHHLARRGWTCISANYHLSSSPGEGFPTHLIDAKAVIAWARSRGTDDHGVDSDTILVAGSSAGAHLTAMTALTVDDVMFQPGFESASTAITAGIGLYGYYGHLGNSQGPSSDPAFHADRLAAPLFVIHGDHDTYTPVEATRRFVAELRAASSPPVVYAELPGAQHSFDLFHSVRFEAVVRAIEVFAAWARSARIAKP